MRPTLCLLLLAALMMPSLARAEPPPAPTLVSDHPLAGRIWQPAEGRWLESGAVLARARAARIVLLGETHDNPDHHAIQAWVMRAVAGPKVAAAFEMIDADRQPLLDGWSGPAADLGPAVDWEGRGWPEWDWYRPIVEAALAPGGRLLAANLPAALTRPVLDGKEPAGLAARLGLDQPLDPAQQSTMAEEIRAAHCGLLPEAMVPKMTRVQRARDAQMAEVVHKAAQEAPVVLIAGSGHARLDRGVPAALARLGATGPVLALALVEVEPGETDPAQYADSFHAGTLPFDLVWFTGRAERDDPCERLRQRRETSAPGR